MIRSILMLVLILATIVACSSTPVYEPLPCPVRPELISITLDEQRQMGPETVQKVVHNQLALKQQVVLLESLAGCTRG